MELLNVVISTPRLLLKPISPTYQEDIFREFTPEIATYLYANPSPNISDTEFFIQQSLLEMAEGKNLVLVILRKDSQEFLGCTGIQEISTRYPKTGLWLKKSAHGQGYGTETIHALKLWVEENLDYEYLKYPVDRKNTPSRNVAEKLGGVIHQEYEYTKLDGRILDIVEYQILKQSP
jgi:ribosomal-protein-alanine N-acetyltransferase